MFFSYIVWSESFLIPMVHGKDALHVETHLCCVLCLAIISICPVFPEKMFLQ